MDSYTLFCNAVVIFVCTILISSSGNSEEPGDLAIEWECRSECATKDQLMNELQIIFGESPPNRKDLSFKVKVSREESSWIASVEVHNLQETYTRKIRTSSCKLAVKVSSLIIALTLDPSSLLSIEDPDLLSHISQTEPDEAEDKPAVPDTPEEPPPRTIAVTITPSEPAIIQQQEKEKVGTEFKISASILGDIGNLPVFGIGPAMSWTISRALFTSEASLVYLPRRSAEIDELSTGAIQMSLFGLSLGGGIVLRTDSIHISFLLGVGLNTIFAESLSIEQPDAGSAFYSTTWFRIPLEWFIKKQFGLRLAPTASYLWSRPEFAIDGIGQVHRPNPLTVALELGLFLRF